MILTSTFHGSFYINPFVSSFSFLNKYIPIYVEHIEKPLVVGEEFLYSLPSFNEENVLKKPNTIRNIKNGLEKMMTPYHIVIGGGSYYFFKGALFTAAGECLLLMCVPKNIFMDSTISIFSEVDYFGKVSKPADPKNYVLFYSSSFFTNPSLSALNRRLQKEILEDCYLKGIEVRVVTSEHIKENAFATSYEFPKVKSVSKLESYMNTVLPTYLYKEDEDSYLDEEKVEPVISELPIEEEALLFDIGEETEIVEVQWPAHTEPFLPLPTVPVLAIELIDDEE
jgi:hypothetical protein